MDKNIKVKINLGNRSQMAAKKFNRNAKCQCGSGKKQKHCCGLKTEYFNTKSNTK